MTNSESKKSHLQRSKTSLQRRKKSDRIGSDAAEQRMPNNKDNKQEETYKILIENIPCAVYSAFPGEKGPTTFMSQKWKDLTGYSAEELYQDPEAWPKCIYPDDRKKAVNAYLEACRNEAPYNLEYRIVHRETGQVRYVRDQGLLSKDAKGTLIRVDGNITDITELKTSENELIKYRDHLEELVKERTTELEKANEVLKLQAQERKKAERDLLLVRQSIEDSGEGICWIDKDARIVNANLAACRQLGYSKEEMLSRTVHDVAPNVPKERWQSLWVELRQKGSMSYETLNIHKSGNIFPVELRLNFVKFEDKEYIFVFVNDISERKQIEDKLRFLSHITEQVDNSVITTDLNYKITWVNKAFQRLYGYAPEEVLGRSPDFPNAEANSKEIQNDIYETVSSGKVWRGEVLNRKKDGSTFPCELMIFPLLDEQGNIIAYAGHQRDITERKKAEESLQKSEHRYRTLVEANPYGIQEINTSGIIIYTNPSYQTMLGYTEKELLGKSILDLLEPESGRDELRDYLSILVKEQPEPTTYYQKNRTKDNRVIDMAIDWNYSRDNEGRVVGFTSVITDITERKLAEEEIQQEYLMRKTLLDHLPCIAMILKKGTREIVASNEAAKKIGAVPGKTCYETCAQRNDPCPFCNAPEVWATDEPKRIETEYEGTYYEGIWVPLTEELYVHYIFDISNRKRAEQKVLDDQDQLKSLASELSITEERERRRIATELHDQIGQSLVFSKIKLDELHHSATSSELTKALDEICNNIGQIIQDTRSLTFDLSSPILNELGLEAAVSDWLDVQIQEKHGIKTEFVDDGQQKPLDDDIKALLFRNVRELLVNVIKHAQANKVKISIRRVNEQIHIDVEDDGKGFDSVKVRSGAAKETKFGLFSIRQRLEQLGGQFEIDTEERRGSKITMTAPLKLTKSQS
ncbi:MAG: PAS domain S-box protein [Planctomycetes bacterium]|nr:PAS domain S-box protein [Planctomycetota bacterium]